MWPCARADVLTDATEEAEHASPEQRRGAFVVGGGRLLSANRVFTAGVQEQLRTLRRIDEITGHVEIALRDQKLVGLHRVNLEGTSCGHGHPNSEVGTKTCNSRAPFAPGRKAYPRSRALP